MINHPVLFAVRNRIGNYPDAASARLQPECRMELQERGGEIVPEWVFFGYLILSLLSLIGAFFGAQWWRIKTDRSALGALKMVARAVLGAFLVMIPLFYLVYAGMIPTGRTGITPMVMNLLAPLGWGHLAIFAWATGRTLRERYVILAALFLSVPVLFFVVGVGAMVRFRYSFALAAWGLLVASLTLWQRFRRHSCK